MEKDNAQELVKISALTAGIIWNENNPKEYLEHPISTVCNGLLYGSICTIGASLVADNLPTKGKYVLAGLIGLSGIYYLGKGYYDLYNGIQRERTSSPIISITYNSSTS
jgi:hypothetical protein